MAAQPLPPVERRRHDPEQEEHLRNGTIKPAADGTFRSLGLGLISGAADDDPSGIATYSIAGAQTGTAMLWTALLTFPLMAAVQMMCARITPRWPRFVDATALARPLETSV